MCSRDLCICKRALYILYIHVRALHTRKRTLSIMYIYKRALYILYIHVRALHTRKRTLSIMYIYKRALHIICIRKWSLSIRKYRRKGTVRTHTHTHTHIHTHMLYTKTHKSPQKSPTHPMYPQMKPICIYIRHTNLCKRAPRTLCIRKWSLYVSTNKTENQRFVCLMYVRHNFAMAAAGSAEWHKSLQSLLCLIYIRHTNLCKRAPRTLWSLYASTNETENPLTCYILIYIHNRALHILCICKWRLCTSAKKNKNCECISIYSIYAPYVSANEAYMYPRTKLRTHSRAIYWYTFTNKNCLYAHTCYKMSYAHTCYKIKHIRKKSHIFLCIRKIARYFLQLLWRVHRSSFADTSDM